MFAPTSFLGIVQIVAQPLGLDKLSGFAFGGYAAFLTEALDPVASACAWQTIVANRS